MKNSKFILAIIIIGLLVYFNSLFNGFVWDDEEQIVNNVLIHSATNIPAFFQSSTFNSAGANKLPGLYYKPLMSTFFSLIYTVFGPRPFFFHLIQLLFHLANSILVFLILKRFLKFTRLSFFLALVFMLHPINTEAVIYISALQDVLFFFFGCLAVWLVINRSSLSTFFTASLFLLFSLFAKETAVIFIILIIFYLRLFAKKKITTFLFPLLLTLITYGVLRFFVARIFFKIHKLTLLSTMSVFDRFLHVPKIILFYLKTFFWPQYLASSQQWTVTAINFFNFFLPFFLNLIFFVILIYFGLKLLHQRKKNLPLYLFFLLWFIFGLGIHLQIFPLDMTVSDRWFYLSQVGLLGIIGIIYLNFARTFSTKVLIVSCVFILTSLALRTFLRTLDWKDGYTLYSRDIKISKDSFDLENNLGVELARKGQLENAKIHFERSIELSPTWWTPYNNLGVYYARTNNLKRAEELYSTSIARGNYYLAYENLAFLLLREKKYQEAIDLSEKSLSFFPNNTRIILAITLAFFQNNNWGEALEWARRLYQISPTSDNKRLVNFILLDSLEKGRQPSF